MVAIKRHKPESATVDEIEGVDILTAEEGRAYFDQPVPEVARHLRRRVPATLGRR